MGVFDSVEYRKCIKADTFGLKILQLTPFVWRSFQYVDLIMFKYDAIRVSYCDLQKVPMVTAVFYMYGVVFEHA